MQMRKFNLTIKKKSKIQKCGFQSPVKTKIKIRVLFFIFKKIQNMRVYSFFKGNLGDVTDQTNIGPKKKI